jgi:hypothetical protein
MGRSAHRVAVAPPLLRRPISTCVNWSAARPKFSYSLSLVCTLYSSVLAFVTISSTITSSSSLFFSFGTNCAVPCVIVKCSSNLLRATACNFCAFCAGLVDGWILFFIERASLRGKDGWILDPVSVPFLGTCPIRTATWRGGGLLALYA